jgi:PAS domain S-box-containing protein
LAEDRRPPGEEAQAAGLGWALAIPLRVGRRVLGVIEVFARKAIPLDDDLRDSAQALGQQIGQYLRRRRAEEALRHREEEFRSLAEKIPQLTWIADPSGAIDWFNRRWYEATGTSPEEVEGWGWLSVYHPEHRLRAEESWREATSSGEVWEVTVPLRSADGRYRWFLSRAVPILDNQGRIERWFGTHTDITEQRRAEARAVQAERRLRLALQVARIGSWSWGLRERCGGSRRGDARSLGSAGGRARRPGGRLPVPHLPRGRRRRAGGAGSGAGEPGRVRLGVPVRDARRRGALGGGPRLGREAPLGTRPLRAGRGLGPD